MTFADAGILFAQAGGRAGAGGGGDAGAAIGGFACMAGYFALIVAALVIVIMLLLSMYKALNECAPANRTMEPVQVWFTFIPIAGIVFFIMALFKVPQSLENEYHDRGLRGDGDFGKQMAIWMLVSYLLCFPVGLVLFVLQMRKFNGYVRELQGGGSQDDDADERLSRRGRRRDDDEDGDEEERPSKRRARDEDEEEDRPSKRRRDDDEDDDDRPSKRRRRDDD